MIENTHLKLARDFVQYTGRNIFLTGKAGTGKTTFLHQLKTQSAKRMIVVAPTGVSAINAGGVTIHSFFQMPFGPILPEGHKVNRGEQSAFKRFSREKINIIRGLDLLVIDEISMVRADLLDGIDEVLRRYKDRKKPFGGIQLLMIGDLHQLAPVIKNDEWAMLQPFYRTGFFFDSLALKKTSFITLHLREIFRQKDEDFIDLLNKIRENKLDESVFSRLRDRFKKDTHAFEQEGYITLTTHNRQANSINEARLNDLEEKVKKFKAYVKGDFPEHIYPTEFELKLKVNAQVMFVKNDSSPEKRYFNGKIGTIEKIDGDVIYVNCEGDDDLIEVAHETWDNLKYSLNQSTKEIEENIAGTFSQYPLKLAWAITIHKSQGLTFEKAIIDAQAAFAHGQVYVALSRCQSLEGLVLSTPFNESSVITSHAIQDFSAQTEDNQPDYNSLLEAKYQYQLETLMDLFDFSETIWMLNRCIKVARENSGVIIGEMSGIFMEMNKNVAAEIRLVGEKFQAQIKKIALKSKDVESNEVLQGRIKDASHYFLKKLNALLIEPLNSLVIDTDNKEVRKSLDDILGKLMHFAEIKLASLEATKGGFVLMDVLLARAKAAVVTQEIRKKKRALRADFSTTAKHPKLYKQLKDWRINKAGELNVSASNVITLRTLINIANLVPENQRQVKELRGIGMKTFEKLDQSFYEILKKYRLENKVADWEEDYEEDPKPVKIDTKKLSLELFHSGMNIQEIAKERGMVYSTIEGHMAHFIGTGELTLDKFMTEEKAGKAITYFKRAKDLHLSPAKDHLGKAYSFGELRMISAHLQYNRFKRKQ